MSRQADQQLDRIVTEYLKACEQGERPDREKILASWPELAVPLSGKVTQVQIVAIGSNGFLQSEILELHVDWVGVRHELTEGVTGRLLLAYQPGDVIDRLVAEAPADAPGLSDTELAQVRRQGHAIRISEAEDGYCGVAVPIRDAGGMVVAAIALGGPRFRVSEQKVREELLPAALNAAARVSEALGHRAA